MYNTASTRCRRQQQRRWSQSSRAMSDSSSMSPTIVTHRKYVDPWDLDLREVSWRHSSDTTDCSADQVVSLSSATGPESTLSDFVYVPGPPKNKNDGATTKPIMTRYECFQCSPKPPLDRLPPDPCKPEMYEYWELGCKHPPPNRYASAAVDDHFYPVAAPAGPSNRCCLLYNVSRPEVRRNSRYNNSDMDSASRTYETSSGEYDSAENLITSQFHYNTLGHMKIDYSSNWNNLDKYICQV